MLKRESPKSFTIGDTVYAVDHRRIREGKVVNESWIGEGANAIDWGQGADPGHYAYRTREGAEAEITGDRDRIEMLKSDQLETKRRSLSLIEQVEKVSPKSKFPSKMREALQKYGKLTPAQTETLNNIIAKKPFRKPNSPRIIRRDGEVIEQYYINPVVGWVDKSEVHEYLDDPTFKSEGCKPVKSSTTIAVSASDASEAGRELSQYGRQKTKYKVTSHKSKGSRKSQHTSTGLGSVR